jgi:hypothetical protein
MLIISSRHWDFWLLHFTCTHRGRSVCLRTCAEWTLEASSSCLFSTVFSQEFFQEFESEIKVSQRFCISRTRPAIACGLLVSCLMLALLPVSSMVRQSLLWGVRYRFTFTVPLASLDYGHEDKYRKETCLANYADLLMSMERCWFFVTILSFTPFEVNGWSRRSLWSYCFWKFQKPTCSIVPNVSFTNQRLLKAYIRYLTTARPFACVDLRPKANWSTWKKQEIDFILVT